MPTLAVHAGRVLTPYQEVADAVVLIADDRIVATGSRAGMTLPPGAVEYEAGEGIVVAPGFVDLHIHGAGGHDVMEATPETLMAIGASAAVYGTTTFVATTVTASADEICRSLEGIARYIASAENAAPGHAQIAGIHLEGPFINPARRGVHPLEHIAAPSLELFQRFMAAADGHIRILTLAPEMPGAIELIAYAYESGVVVSLGHTDATYEEARAAIGCGASHAAHVFNAMRPFTHRETGVIGAVLTDPRVTAEVIADGIHVDEPALRLLLSAKGAAKVLLVSDATAATNMPDGSYRLGNIEVQVRNGVCRNAEGRLAGSTLTLDRAVRRMAALGVPLVDAVRMATLQPAHRIGQQPNQPVQHAGFGPKGVLVPGAAADLVLLTADLHVARVMSRGLWIS